MKDFPEIERNWNLGFDFSSADVIEVQLSIHSIFVCVAQDGPGCPDTLSVFFLSLKNKSLDFLLIV